MGANATDLYSTIEAARAGNPAALHVFYLAYGDAIHRYCYAWLGDAVLAHRCTEQVFVRLWKEIHDFEHQADSSFTSWVYTIAHQVVVSYVHPRQHAVHVSSTPALYFADGRSRDRAGTRCVPVVLGEALRHLTAEQQQVITLKFFGGLSNREIGAALGHSEDEIKALQHHALRCLQQLLGVKQAHQPATRSLGEGAC